MSEEERYVYKIVSESKSKILNNYFAKIKKRDEELMIRIAKAIEILKLCDSKCARETINILEGREDK